MKINDLNEKFEDFEKENTGKVLQGLVKITGMIILAAFLVLFEKMIYMQCYFSFIMNSRSAGIKEKITMLAAIFTLFSLIVIIVSAIIFIKMIKDYFNENSMELSHKIKYYVIIFIGILIIINSIIGTSEVLKQMKLNFTFIQKIMLFLFSGIPSGVIATSATAFFSVVFLFSVKTYEKKLYEHRIIGIIYTAIVSIIGLLGINFIMELSNLYKNYSFKVGHEFKLFIHFLKFVLRYKNLYIEIFNMYFCVNLFVIIFLGILLIFAKKNRYVFNISESLPIGIYQKLEDKNFQKGDLVVLDIPKERMDFMISRGYIDGNMLKTMLKRIEGVEGETFKVLSIDELKNSQLNKNIEFSSIDIPKSSKKFLVKENKILGSISNFDSHGRELPQMENPLILNKDEFFVMGESDNSFDSRYFGKIKKEEILYKVKPILTF